MSFAFAGIGLRALSAPEMLLAKITLFPGAGWAIQALLRHANPRWRVLACEGLGRVSQGAAIAE